MDERALNKLEHLQTLYRRSYQSEVMDQSVTKIIELERAAAQRELEDLQARLADSEAEYDMSSAAFYRRFRAGELGDEADLVEWSVFYDMRESVRQRLQLHEVEPS